MKRFRIKIQFKSPVHIGCREGLFDVTDTTIHSDTIFSAIINCYSIIYGVKRASQMLEYFKSDNIPFMVSSSFYYIGNEYMLPRPLGLDITKLTAGDFKKSKKIKYISEEIIKNNTKSHNYYIKCGCLMCQEFDKDIFLYEERPRVAVDRNNNGSHIYYSSACRFSEGCGLWFFIDINEAFEEEIFTSLKLLGDEGIGGERTYGYGIFDYTQDVIENDITKGPYKSKYMLISLCIPNENDNLSKIEYFNLIERMGYIYSPYLYCKKHNIYTMLQEGSVIGTAIKGKVVENEVEGFNIHKIYKYGLAFLIPFEMGA